MPREAVQDPWEKNEPGLGLGRDPSRTPFQWNAKENAGFTCAKPWLPIDSDYAVCNAEMLRDDSTSILALYHRLLGVRRRHEALATGSFRMIDVQGNVLIYERVGLHERILVYLNFGDIDQVIAMRHPRGARILASTHLERTNLNADVRLRRNEGLTVLLPP